MKIFDNLLSGPMNLWNFFHAMSRTQLVATGVTSLIFLSIATPAAATIPLSTDCSPAVSCETVCSTIPGGVSVPDCDWVPDCESAPECDITPDCDLTPVCTSPNSPSNVWVSPDTGSAQTTFPVITPPAIPVCTEPTIPFITPPTIPVVTQPSIPVITPPEVTNPVTNPTTSPVTPPPTETFPVTDPTTTPSVPVETGAYPAPVVRVSEEADGVRVTWDAVNSSDFFAYVVVFSSTNPNPAYPNDSYYSSITDRNLTSCLIESRYIKGGEYYFSVTALYNGKEIAVAGNAVKATMPALPTPPAQPEGTYPAVTLNALSYDGINMNVSWSKTSDATGFIGYKVVAAIDDTTPTFPENGCAAFISSADTTSTSYVINGAFLAGRSYSVTVIAVYSVNGVEHNIPANVQTIQF